MMRSRCESCGFLLKQCLCSDIRPIKSNYNIVILQHPSELRQAKATAKLVALSIKNCFIHVGETTEDFSNIRERILGNIKQWALIYPVNNAELLISGHPQFGANRIKSLLFLDGTWRKSKKILALNPWLTQLPMFKLPDEKSSYRIRASRMANSFSTLEAVAQTLAMIDGVVDNSVDGTPLSNLYHLQDQMMAHQLNVMPPHIRKRYGD